MNGPKLYHSIRPVDGLAHVLDLALRFLTVQFALVMTLHSISAQDVTSPSLVSAFKAGNKITLEFSESLSVNAVAGSTVFRLSEDFEYVADAADIYDGFELVGGWENAGGTLEYDISEEFLTLIAADQNGWIQHDNDETAWELGVADGGSWTAEIRVSVFPDEENGLAFWAANGKERGIIQINDLNTQILGGQVLDQNDNTNEFHTFRMAYASNEGLYFIWRDDVLLTPSGVPAQASTSSNRFIVGDCCSGLLMTEVDIAHIRYDTTEAFSPTEHGEVSGANLMDNYEIAGGTVVSAEVKEDGKTVVIVTEGVEASPTVNLTIRKIEDLAGNLFEATSVEVQNGGAKITELSSDGFEYLASAGDIFEDGSLVNGWENAGGNIALELSGNVLKLTSGDNNGWLQHDNDMTPWETGVADGLSWTAEIRVKLSDDEGNGLTLWGANGVSRNIIQINTDTTQILGGSILDEQSNINGFHTFRLAYEWQDNLYFVWRDGNLITPDGVPAQAPASNNRFIVGDCCGGIFMSTVELEYIRYDTTGAYSPPAVTELDSADFEYTAAANEIFDGDTLKNQWTNEGGTTEFELHDGYLTLVSASNNGWIQHDSDTTPWESGVVGGGSWTAEIRVRVRPDEGNGLVLWGANGQERNIVQINSDSTQVLGGNILNEDDNSDGFHTFRLAFESGSNEYFIWRDGELISIENTPAQAPSSNNRFIVGDCCSGINMSKIDLVYIRYDTTGAFSPTAVSQMESTQFQLTADAGQIFDGVDLLGDWVNAGGFTDFELSDGALTFISTENNGWIEHNTEDATPWELGVAEGGSWTAEIRVKLAADEGNGLVLWAANGSERNILQINEGNTQWFGGAVLLEATNTDDFHTFRMAFDSQDGLYYAWRDDVLLAVEGVSAQAATDQNRFIIGDCCSSIEMTNFDLEFIRYDTTGAFSPFIPAPPVTTPPSLSMSRDENGHIVIEFTGHLEEVSEMNGIWKVISDMSPTRISSDQLKGKAFYRAVSHE
ncbi:MAG: hypothetical protein HN505_00805 [Verrucomicrobia bacterium]|nr:hypothetical protein [Verrucomicrobiota bacterium]MBT5477670.1 hypothetical protein [Verrucomicrobiota bacterium]MBT6239709.1 hypothetical protein [Verrucomicrobiota bacterium]